MHHFQAPHITGAKNWDEFITALNLWRAFRALRDAGQNE